jgi:hypothetical protein
LLREAMERGALEIEAFIPLASSPPGSDLSSIDPATERFMANGLWDVGASPARGVAREILWLDELAALSRRLGRDIVSAEAYRCHYRVGTPAGLAGHERFPQLSPRSGCAPPLAAFPLAAPIAPQGCSDARHALIDPTAWKYVNAQIILGRFLGPAIAEGKTISPSSWQRLLSLADECGPSPPARVDGGHLFFLGEAGARATVEALPRLIAWARATRSMIAHLLSGSDNEVPQSRTATPRLATTRQGPTGEPTG